MVVQRVLNFDYSDIFQLKKLLKLKITLKLLKLKFQLKKLSKYPYSYKRLCLNK